MSAGRFVTSTATPYSNAVGGIMLACGCNRAEAFMAYFQLCALIHLDGRGRKYIHATRETVDERAELPGFAAGLERLGWVTFDPPHGTPMRWNWKLHKGHITKLTAAKLAAGKAKDKGVRK